MKLQMVEKTPLDQRLKTSIRRPKSNKMDLYMMLVNLMITAIIQMGLAVTVTLVLAVLSLPSIREFILWTGFRLDPSLLEPAGLAFPVAALYPALYGHRQYFQGLFVRAGCTGYVGRGAVLRIVVILVAAPLLLGPMGANGARLGVTLACVGLLAEDVFLEIMARRSVFPRLEAGERL